MATIHRGDSSPVGEAPNDPTNSPIITCCGPEHSVFYGPGGGEWIRINNASIVGADGG